MNLTFIQTPMFIAQAARLKLTDEDVQALEKLIMDYPQRGDLMRGTGGIRKIRFAPPSWHVGKSGATRACYVLFSEAAACYFVSIFAKNDKANLSAEDKTILRKWVEATRRKMSGG
ncbi:MAG TPA: type II toxin-antitoxin system RelE/ParE family toxin [Tepidisphaeraceae bacterium]|jgi:hypothetical protein